MKDSDCVEFLATGVATTADALAWISQGSRANLQADLRRLGELGLPPTLKAISIIWEPIEKNGLSWTPSAEFQFRVQRG